MSQPTLPLDPNRGFLLMTIHWQPNPQDPDPQLPGQKRAVTRFVMARANDPCLCGSGKPFKACCQLRPYWHPICPDPDGGYSLLAPQIATFGGIDGAAVRARLLADRRLRAMEVAPDCNFWVYWGDPPVEEELGILCFADLELKDNSKLVVSAMDASRMELMLDLLKEIAGDLLGVPEMSFEQVPVFNKRTRKQTTVPPVKSSPRPPINRSKKKR